MPKRLKRKHRIPRFRLRRRRNVKIPLLPTVGFVAPAIFGNSGGWTSPFYAAQMGRFDLAFQTFVRNCTGIKLPLGGQRNFEWNIFDTFNPFNFGEAQALKGLIWGSVASLVLRLLGVNRKFTQATRKIPILNKFSL